MTTTSASDPALVSRIASGDTHALAALYDRHSRTAYGLALRILRDRDLAEDAVQEAFLALWRTAASFDPARGKVSTWIHLLVHRRAVDLVRRSERQRAADVRHELLEDVREADAEEIVVGRETASRASAALQELAACQREVIELAFYDGLSQSEIAVRLGLPLGTVKSRTFAGLARLRDLLEGAEQPVGRPAPTTRGVGARARLARAA